MMPPANNLLLTGVPGCGKTTVIEKVCAAIGPSRLRGFITREIRDSGTRLGFTIETLDGRSATMAHTTFRSGPRVGRYVVDVDAVDAAVRHALVAGDPASVYVVDEIGKMECASHLFRQAIEHILGSPSIVVATIARRGSGFIDRIKKRQDIEMWEVTHGDRDAMPERICRWIRERGREARS